MELLLTGPPGPLLGFAEKLIIAVAAAAGHPAPTLRHHDPVVEDVAVADAVRNGDLCAVVVIGDPVSCLVALVGSGHTPQEGARALSAAAAALVVWADWMTIRLRPDMTIGEATAAILGGMGIAADTAPAAPITEWDAASSLADVAASLAAPAPDVSGRAAEIQTLAREVVGPLFAAATTGIRQAVTWSRACLFWGDHPGEKLPRIVDLTGPARVLAYGPYFHLPPGGWTVRATLAFSPAAVGTPFAVELRSDALLGQGRFKLGAAGVFAASFPAEVRSAHVPNEIRVITEIGAIDGEIGVDHILLIPRA